MPVSAIHLENMLKLARLGVAVLPASPGFYHKPTTVDDMVDFVVARILDHLDIEHDLIPRWGETP
jgi:4-hydroxy-3-polyprenylbenzoate decarboxylase